MFGGTNMLKRTSVSFVWLQQERHKCFIATTVNESLLIKDHYRLKIRVHPPFRKQPISYLKPSLLSYFLFTDWWF